MTWAILGPMVLLLTISGIVSRGGGWFTGLDVLFAMVVGLMILGRWVEQRSGCATTLRGEPATVEQGKRYAAVLLLAAAATWIAAKVVGNHLLP